MNNPVGLKLKYNSQWLAILKSMNVKPCPIEDIENIFNGAYDVPQNFETIGCEIVGTFYLPDAQENPASKTIVTNELWGRQQVLKNSLKSIKYKKNFEKPR